MKKITIISIITFLFFLLSSVLTYCLKIIVDLSKWKFLIIGAVLILLSGILAIIFEKKIYILCLVMNSIALSFMMRAWYLYTGHNNSLLIMILLAIMCVSYLWIFYGLIQIPFIERHIKGFAIIFVILSIIIYILIIIFTKTSFMSTLGYYSIINISFVICLCINAENFDDVIMNMMIASFSVVLVGIVIALIMLEVEIDSFDLDIIDLDLKNPKNEVIDVSKPSVEEKNNQQYM